MSQCGVVPPGGVSERGNGVPLRGSSTVSGAVDWVAAEIDTVASMRSVRTDRVISPVPVLHSHSRPHARKLLPHGPARDGDRTSRGARLRGGLAPPFVDNSERTDFRTDSELIGHRRVCKRRRRGIDPGVQPGVLQSWVPPAIPGRDILGPVARNGQAECQQGHEGDALGDQRRRVE